MRLTFTPRQRTLEDKKVIFTQPVSLPLLNLGNFTLTTTETGAIESKPVSAPPSQEPADVVKPASLVLGTDRLELISSAETGGAVLLSDLLEKLLDTEINLEGIGRMPLKSLFNVLFSRVGVVESNVADISGVRLAAEEAKSAAQVARDALQDVSGALLELASATAASDLAGVLGRLTTLESAPSFDATSITNRLDAAESAIGGKADTTYVDSGLATKAAASDLSALDSRVGAIEGAGFGGRLDALEAAVPSKVAQADYDVYVAANDAAVAAAASAAASAASDAAAASASVAGKEDKGRIHSTDLVMTDVSGVNAAYWSGSLDATIGAIVAAGKVAAFRADGANPISHFLSVADAAVAGDTYRFSNKSAEALWGIVLGSQGGEAVDVLPGETVTVVSAGSGAWNIL